MRKFIASLFLIFTIALTAQDSTPKKRHRVPLIIVNPGSPVAHWGCPAGYSLRQHEWETLPTGEMRETWHSAQSDYTLITESKRHFNACVDINLPDWDPELKKMSKE